MEIWQDWIGFVIARERSDRGDLPFICHLFRCRVDPWQISQGQAAQPDLLAKSSFQRIPIFFKILIQNQSTTVLKLMILWCSRIFRIYFFFHDFNVMDKRFKVLFNKCKEFHTKNSPFSCNSIKLYGIINYS